MRNAILKRADEVKVGDQIVEADGYLLEVIEVRRVGKGKKDVEFRVDPHGITPAFWQVVNAHHQIRIFKPESYEGAGGDFCGLAEKALEGTLALRDEGGFSGRDIHHWTTPEERLEWERSIPREKRERAARDRAAGHLPGCSLTKCAPGCKHRGYGGTVASTIAEQLGNKALTMWGAKELVDEGDALKFKVGRNPEGVTHIRVFLRPDDTYNVEAWKIRGTSVKQVGLHQVVYVEDLRRVIQDLTGLRYSL